MELTFPFSTASSSEADSASEEDAEMVIDLDHSILLTNFSYYTRFHSDKHDDNKNRNFVVM